METGKLATRNDFTDEYLYQDIALAPLLSIFIKA
jgi:hypothetical protein